MRTYQRLIKGPRSVAAVGFVALALLFSVLPAAAAPIVVIDEGDAIPAIQYAGENRFDTAALIATDPTSARATFDSPSDTVVIATGDKFPDAIAASYVAGIENSPILLSRTPDLSDEARGAIDELDPNSFIIVGGELAVDSSVETELEGLASDTGTVTRVGGLNRAGTAAELARLGDADGDGELDNGVDTAIVANDGEFAGALSAGPLAFAEGIPVLVTSPLGLSPETAEVIPELGITEILVAGNDQIIPDSIVDELAALGVSTERVGADVMMTDTGTDTPTDTLDTDSDTTLSAAFALLSIEEYGFSDAHVNLATNSDFADALTIGAHAGADFVGPSPILLTEGEVLGDNAEGVLLELASDCGLLAIHIAGGEVAVPDAVIDDARAAGTCTNADRIETAVGAETATNHLQAWQDIASANPVMVGDTLTDTRAAGTPGYDLSVDYVVEQLEAAGYEPTVEEFNYVLFSIDGETSVTVDGAAELTDDQASIMSFSGNTDAAGITAAIEPVDLQLADPTLSDSGCTNDITSGDPEDDFTGFTPGNIALMQRGACSFAEKADNALAAGAAGALIFNQGNEDPNDDRFALLNGTLGAPIEGGETFPVFGLDYASGEDLAAATPDVTIVAEVSNTPDVSTNVIADTPSGDPDSVVMIGAHLDSVQAGPGIQDNGTGSAGILDIALQMAAEEVETENTVRFAWWGAEELGLIGSDAYVFGDGDGGLEPGLSIEEYNAIKLYLNFDMIGSPNFVRFIYDGDGDAFDLVGPPGSAEIEEAFEDYYSDNDLASAPTAFSGRSDYQAFINVGIPAGGLFTGAEGIKTEEEAAIFGGDAGVAYDACYHLVCDTIDNVNQDVLDDNVKAIARVTLTYADSLESIPEREPLAASFAQSGPLVSDSTQEHSHDDGHDHSDGFNNVYTE